MGILEKMLLRNVLLGSLFTLIESFDKTVDVNGLKLYGENSDQVHFKFQLSKTDNPKLTLVVSQKWVPLQIQILGKRRMIQLYFVAPGGKLQKRGRPIRVSALSNLNRDNELIVGFDDRTWNIVVNGVDISEKFDKPLIHNGSWKRIRRARGTSKNAVRRFAVTENREIPAWRDLNHAQCGYHYKLTSEQDEHLRLNVPDLVLAYEHGTELIDQCLAKNEGLPEVANRIVGGQASVPGYYPWLVALRLRNTHQCGASLINKCWIISAAHCFPSKYNEENFVARIGDYYNRKDANDANVYSQIESVHESKLKRVIKHRSFNPSDYSNDIALAELENCVPDFNQFRSPICLPTATHQHGSGECCHIHGWGKTASNQFQLDQFIALDKQKVSEDPTYKSIYPKGDKTELFPSEMQATANYIQTDEVCKKHYEKLYKNQLQLCAAHMLSSGIAADACQGDSGGPLACVNPASSETNNNKMGELLDNSRFTLWGLTSFGKADEETGFGCSGIGSKPGMYTKVASYMDWINTVFKANNVDPNA